MTNKSKTLFFNYFETILVYNKLWQRLYVLKILVVLSIVLVRQLIYLNIVCKYGSISFKAIDINMIKFNKQNYNKSLKIFNTKHIDVVAFKKRIFITIKY